ncbi:hypothetical protein [Agromyces sp. C10]|uniref:hypothetical protein n=1 Tax=Agromyces sp. C10 TaxID=2935077 RepID=UPI00200A20F8|nr:hypothetical protein [Agromyces sp. C10]MCK8609005.1 hypothetical protein [Agromyces sp. C10]
MTGSAVVVADIMVVVCSVVLPADDWVVCSVVFGLESAGFFGDVVSAGAPDAGPETVGAGVVGTGVGAGWVVGGADATTC